ncbi:MAG: ATP-dependent DNA helicase [Acidobacteria bacterium]|nr:ATP-dependent DNA helicase [Acidobacteriota bacterium]
MPEVPAVSGTPGLTPPQLPASTEAVREVFSEGGSLARVLKGYEPREGQRRMAEAVASVVDAGGTLLAEAGTGTGKTLAYLIPSILSGHRVLVSTGTKNLQEQIFFKDLPALQDALGVSFTATLMKGRANYLCLHRWELYRDGVEGSTSAAGRLVDTSDRVLLPIIGAWVKNTDTGDRAELRDLPEDLPLWSDIAAEADTCLGADCRRYNDCFVTRMRQRAAESDVVIVNHHLLCADASVRQSAYGEVIPFCPTLVIDEAHQLEDVATQYFGRSLSAHRIEDLVRDGGRLLPASAPQQTEAMARALARVADRSRMFFSGLALPFDSRSGDPEQRRGAARAPHGGRATPESRFRYTAESLADHFEEGMALAGALEGLEATLALAQSPAASATESDRGPTAADAIDANEAVVALQRRAGELRNDLCFLLRATDPDFVYYIETRGRGRAANADRPAGAGSAGREATRSFLRASPIDVSRIVRDVLFERVRAIVLTSATLAVDGSFEYVKGRLGIRRAEELRVASEFDYATQALLYLPRRLPPPKAPAFAEAAAREITELVKRSRGRAFVLFTSYAVLRAVQRVVEMALPYPMLVQGAAPRTELIERFRSTPNAVLLATSSFWQGVDVVGEALSCVIIDKLPFASPGDPVTAARIDAINAAGGDAFADYQVPLAILALQQGLGRLIRHRTDRGVLAVLDPRLRTRGYGRRFLASLPPAPVTHDIEAVGRFFV